MADLALVFHWRPADMDPMAVLRPSAMTGVD